MDEVDSRFIPKMMVQFRSKKCKPVGKFRFDQEKWDSKVEGTVAWLFVERNYNGAPLHVSMWRVEIDDNE